MNGEEKILFDTYKGLRPESRRALLLQAKTLLASEEASRDPGRAARVNADGLGGIRPSAAPGIEGPPMG